MAEGITARIDQIKNGVALLSREAKQAANETAQLNTKLKFDPSNVNLVVERYQALQKELDANNKRIEGLKKAQQELASEKAKITGTDAESLRQLADIEKVAAQYARDLEKAELNATRLNEITKQQYKNQDLIRAVTLKVNERFDMWVKLADKVQQATKRIYNTLKDVVTQASETGLQLSSLAKRYNTTAEDIQTWDRALQLATGQSELFTQSLGVMVKGMAQIAAGRGVAFQKALKNIGVAYKDIKDLSASEQFEVIVEGLKGVENYSTRAAAAQQLFGESGQYIASVLNDGGAALEGFRERAEEFGIIANTDAEALAQMNILLEQAKSQFTVAKAELAVALIPAVEALTDLIRYGLVPVIKWVSDVVKAFGKSGQTAILVMAAMVVGLSALIKRAATTSIYLMALQSRVQGVTGAVVGLNAALGVIGIVLMAISALITLIVTLVGKANEEAKQATQSLNEFAETAENLGLIGTQTQANIESTSTAIRTQTIDITVDIS